VSQPVSTQPEPAESSTGPSDAEHEPTGTGHPDVDAALDRLQDLDGLPVADHVEVYDEVQRRLATTMDDTQDRQPPAGTG
jgi:hypothetical protein